METSIEFAEKLDKELRYFCEGNTNVNGNGMLMGEVGKRLIADGYVETSRIFDTGQQAEARITERGRVFYANGGYTKQFKEEEYIKEERANRKKDRCDQKWYRWLSFAAIFVSTLCAIAQLITNCTCKIE